MILGNQNIGSRIPISGRGYYRQNQAFFGGTPQAIPILKAGLQSIDMKYVI